MRFIVELITDTIGVALRAAIGFYIFNGSVVRAITDARHTMVYFARCRAAQGEIGKYGRIGVAGRGVFQKTRSEEHTSELQSLMRISYAVFCLKKKQQHQQSTSTSNTPNASTM